MLTRTDDANAFGLPPLLRINFEIPEGQTCSKAILYCGAIKLTFDNPISPIEFSPTSEQTAIMKDNNCCSLELFDGENRKLTIPCIAEFKTREGVK